MLTVAQGIPPQLTTPLPILRSPVTNLPDFLVSPSLELMEQGTINGNNQIVVSPGLTGITQVEVGGIIYTLSPSPEPTEGTFWYDPDTSTITLGGTLRQGETAYLFRQIIPLKTDRLWDTHPTLSSWAIGRIAYQTRLGEPPNIGEIEFRCNRSQKADVESLLGVRYPMIVNGHTYYPNGRSVTETPYQNQVKITSGFSSQFREHPTRSNLDKPVKIKPLIVHGQDGDYFTTSAIAATAGVPYSGVSIRVDVPRKLSSAATTTLRQVLSRDRLIANGCFVRYDKAMVEVVKWTSVATWAINDDLIKGESRPTLNYNGEGFALNGVPLRTELRGVVLELDKTQETQPGDKLETKITGDDNPETPPTTDFGFYQASFNPDKLRSPGQCFDNGGPTKRRITTKIQNGLPLEEIEETYGFAYSSLDIYDWTPNTIANKQNGFNLIPKSGVSPENLWQLVKTVKKSYLYNKDGHLTQVTTTVRELTRILKESDALEAINAYATYWNTSDPRKNLQNPANAKQDYEARFHRLTYPCYQFSPFTTAYTAQSSEALNNPAIANDLRTQLDWNPWRAYTFTEVRNPRSLADFYPDIRRPDEEETDWVEPKFLEKREINIENIAVVPDPRTTQKDKKPPLVFGEVTRQSDKTEIVSPKNPERYKTITVSTNQKGEGLGQAVTDRQVQYGDGRPNPLERLESYGRRSPLHDDEDKPKTKYLVNTGGLTPSTVESTTIRFPGCYTLTQAQLALHHYLLQENLTALTCTIPLNYAQPYRCGDRVSYGGKTWRILSITNNQEIVVDGTLRQRDYVVELGIDYGSIPFTVQTIKS